MKTETIIGFHALSVILQTAPGRIKEVFLEKTRRDKRMQMIHAECQQAGIVPVLLSKEALDAQCGENHQGVIASLEPGRDYTEQDLYAMVKKNPSSPLILVLDGITDPNNIGACLRTADAAGVVAVVVPKDNSAGLTEVAKKVASGAADTVPLIAVTNLSRCLKKLQELGMWVTGTAGEATVSVYQADLSGARVIVMGAEGKGMRRLTRDNCDELVNIPMMGLVSSLNVSVATGVVLFESLRQRNVELKN